jgi:hypothetical protein
MNDYINDIKKFFKVFVRNVSSEKYHYDSEWNVTGTTYEYIQLSSNIEIDLFGYSTEDVTENDPSPKSVFLYLHIRNTVEVSESFLADMLRQVREFILNKVKDLDYEHRFSDVLSNIDYRYPNLDLEFPKIIIDPGFTGHAQNEARDTGLSLSTFAIHYPELGLEEMISFLREGQINFVKFLESPEQYYSMAKLPIQVVDRINSFLAKLDAQKNTLKKKQIMMKHILKGGNTTLSLDPYGTGEIKVEINWNYEGITPKLDYEANHGENYNAKVIGKIKTRYYSRLQGEFVIRVKTKFPDINDYILKNDIINAFKKYLETITEKNNLSIVTSMQNYNLIFI